MSIIWSRTLATDKTQVFHDQIQAKQKELQPWTAQINTKQAEIDVATSERDALSKKAQALQAANKEAKETLEALQEDLQTKVIWKVFAKCIGSFTSFSKVSKQDELKDEKRSIQNDIQVAQKKAKVRFFHFITSCYS
jgi:structural maintenance of chromosome 4